MNHIQPGGGDMLRRPSLASLLAVTAVLAAPLALAAAAEARKKQRYDQPRSYQGYTYQPRGYSYRQPGGPGWERLVCEERAQAADPTGLYAGYPCWAREAFGRSPGGRR
jgi:hypothetical protein